MVGQVIAQVWQKQFTVHKDALDLKAPTKSGLRASRFPRRLKARKLGESAPRQPKATQACLVRGIQMKLKPKEWKKLHKAGQQESATCSGSKCYSFMQQ